MGRIMSFGQDGRMVRDFDKSEHDFLRRYGRTPDEVLDENDRLIVKLNAEHIVRQNVEVENAKLRQQLADVTESVGRMEERCAKLRELVRAMYYCHLPWKDCDKCAMNGADMHVEIDEMEFCDGMNDRMRQLGVIA